MTRQFVKATGLQGHFFEKTNKSFRGVLGLYRFSFGQGARHTQNTQIHVYTIKHKRIQSACVKWILIINKEGTMKIELILLIATQEISIGI